MHISVRTSHGKTRGEGAGPPGHEAEAGFIAQKVPAASPLGWSQGGPSPATALLVLALLMELHERGVRQVLQLPTHTETN